MTTHSLLDEVADLRPKWGWFLVLGIGLLVLGVVALGLPWVTTLTSVLFYGWLLVFGGVFEIVSAFRTTGWRGILLQLLGGILSLVVGALIVAHPDAGALGLTLVLATLFLVGGLFRTGAAIVLRFPSWGWSAVSGIVTALLGVYVWAAWPVSALWVIGTLVGIELLSRGWAWVMFAFAVRHVSKTTQSIGQPLPQGA
jgi:uncharacterized membrane protein HdeD (DUF308 family)